MTNAGDDTRLATWRGWIGRSERRSEVLCIEALRRYAAAVGADLDVERVAPPLAHWAFFLPVAVSTELGRDGHPHRTGLLPPVDLPRRMFAASDIQQSLSLRLGENAELTSTVRDVTLRSARSGQLVFVVVERRIHQGSAEVLLEQQTIVYRTTGEATPAPQAIEIPPGAADELWTPGSVDLFRFSAATFNSHRIHYDRAYATAVEGYPDLVVHGPFTAARLYNFAQRRLGRTPKRFAFRALAPLFVDQTVRLTTGDAADTVCAMRCDAVIAMTAEVEP